MSDRLWITDFKYDDGAMLVKKTGHRVPLTFSLAHDIFTWFCFYFFAQTWRTWRRVTGHKRPTIAFYPDKPRPWYFIWPVTHVSGAKLIDDVATADIVMQFDDSTETDNTVPMVRDGAKLVNFTCDDISKSTVAAAFGEAAGYSLAVDPTTHQGRMLDEPRNCYTSDEIAVIERFAASIGLDWGGVDVLRDRSSGRIYIVDANKTDMGPPVALKLGAKLRATRRMAQAFAVAFASKKR